MRRFAFVFTTFLIICHSVCLAAPPSRVVSLGPNITETLFALGAGDAVVAVSDFCIYPPEVMNLPRLGGEWNPNIEALARLEPDMVFIQGRQDTVAEWCRTRGIRLLRVDMDSLESIYAGIEVIAAAMGCEDKGREVNRAIQLDLASVARAVEHRSRQKVFLALGGEAGGTAGLFTAGGTSFLSELLNIAGGENVFADLERAYSDVSLESLLHRHPDLILDLRPGDDARDHEVKSADLSYWRKMVGPDCRIIILTQNYLLLPGPRAAWSARALARTLHPEAAHVLDGP